MFYLVLEFSSETISLTDDVTPLLDKYKITHDQEVVKIKSFNYTDWASPLDHTPINNEMLGHALRAFDAVKECNQTDFNTHYEKLDVNGFIILENIPFASQDKQTSPFTTVRAIAHYIEKSGRSLDLPKDYYNIPTEDILKLYIAPDWKAEISKNDEKPTNQMNDLNILDPEKSANSEEKMALSK